MGEVIQFNGVTGLKLPPSRVLGVDPPEGRENANCAVVGLDREGKYHFWLGDEDRYRTSFAVEKAKEGLRSGRIEAKRSRFPRPEENGCGSYVVVFWTDEVEALEVHCPDPVDVFKTHYFLCRLSKRLGEP
jgi:hypothetical protein